jgi:hypothetical protein
VADEKLEENIFMKSPSKETQYGNHLPKKATALA